MITVLTFVLSLSLLVFLHELGHYLAARFVGVSVEEFSIGLPPKVWGKKVGETEYCISALPLGGYVKLKGLDTEEHDSSDPTNYKSKTAKQKLLILTAGPAMNLLVAFIFMPMALMWGVNQPAYMTRPALVDTVAAGSVAFEAGLQQKDLIIAVGSEPVANFGELSRAIAGSIEDKVSLTIRRGGQVMSLTYDIQKMKAEKKGAGFFVWQEAAIGAVREGSPAEFAGLQQDDLITAIAGNPVASWRDMPPLIQNSKGGELKLLVVREGREIELFMTPEHDEARNHYFIGVSPPSVTVQLSLLEAIPAGASRVINLGKQTLGFVFQLISGKASSDTLGGPIMIAQVMGKAAQQGASELLGLLSFISLQLGIFNLFPIPALDGGHIFFILIEKIKGSPIKGQVKDRITQFGFSMLLMLILWVSIQDGIRLLS